MNPDLTGRCDRRRLANFPPEKQQLTLAVSFILWRIPLLRVKCW
jgi:hypothetical protein